MNSYIYIAIIVIMFIWIWRGNKKNQVQAQKMQESIKPGMYVMLKDGLFGTIVDVMENDAVINLSVDGADEGCVTISKANIHQVIEEAMGDMTGSAAALSSTSGSIEDRVNRAAMLTDEEADEKDAEIDGVFRAAEQIGELEDGIIETTEENGDAETGAAAMDILSQENSEDRKENEVNDR